MKSSMMMMMMIVLLVSLQMLWPMSWFVAVVDFVFVFDGIWRDDSTRNETKTKKMRLYFDRWKLQTKNTYLKPNLEMAQKNERIN